MKTRVIQRTPTEERGAVVFVVVVVLLLLLLAGTGALFLGGTRVVPARTAPAPSPTVSLRWTFAAPSLEQEGGRWTIRTELELDAADPVRVQDLTAVVTRGARRSVAEVTTPPPAGPTRQFPLVFELDEIPGAAKATLEVTFTAVVAGGVETRHVHRAELPLE